MSAIGARGGELMAEAGKLAAGQSPPEAHRLTRVFARTSEVITAHQRLEAIHRLLLKIADPGKAPEGVSQTA